MPPQNSLDNEKYVETIVLDRVAVRITDAIVEYIYTAIDQALFEAGVLDYDVAYERDMRNRETHIYAWGTVATTG